ncbi:hypothetical protein FIBSPDRAFT_891114 [Athelia psychrophila]|uniref:Major facilitator superfamily (MFS) profile domain-containing protein n=1 Tax=Athelia psychrophila TaxID=1759441 RepID=A0A166K0S7_9AGAM|nr:hypothetical protein FIBSPDRAFT_891114 [Fibularhizoctonia sp. CBS 109695]
MDVVGSVWGWLARMVLRRHRLLLRLPPRDEPPGPLRQVRAHLTLHQRGRVRQHRRPLQPQVTLVFNLALCYVIKLGSGLVKIYPQFLAARSLLGAAMGGFWGLSAPSALENLPVELCGLASGVLHQGRAVGYLITAAVYLCLVPEQSRG